MLVLQIKLQGNVVAARGAPITLIIRVIRVIVSTVISIRVINKGSIGINKRHVQCSVHGLAVFCNMMETL